MRIDKTNALVAHTLVHELAHAMSSLSNRITDHVNQWKNVIALDVARAIKNADSYAYIGTWAILADMGYTLVRLRRDADQTQRDAVEARVQKGAIVKNEDVTRRSLRAEKFFT